MHAELNGILCSGALNGKQHTHALLEERAREAKSLTHDEALVELTLRYFTSHAPATAKDFKWWSSLTAVNIKKGLEMAAPQLKNEIVDEITYWFAGAGSSLKAASSTVHLLQGYDEYIVGYKESKYLLDVPGAARSATRDKSVFNNIVLLDGQVADHWKRTLKKTSILIEAPLYAPFDDAQSEAL